METQRLRQDKAFQEEQQRLDAERRDRDRERIERAQAIRTFREEIAPKKYIPEEIERLKKTVARYTEPYEIGSIEGEARDPYGGLVRTE